jgi:hypothetical protein
MPGVILFQGFSQYQNFNTMTAELAAAYREAGIPATVIDARVADYPKTVRALVDRGGIRAVITITGFGLDIGKETNAYSGMAAPVISLYYDPLFYYLEQLRLPVRPRIVTTSSDTEVTWWHGQADSPADIRHLPHAATPQPSREWDDRTIPLLLSGTGCENPEGMRAGWDQYGPATRDHLNRILEVVLGDARPRPLPAIIAEVIGDEVALSSPWAFRRYVLWIDLYLRARLRWRLVTALADRPLLVVGEGWDRLGEHLRTRGRSRVRFRRSLPTPSVYELTSRVQISLNDSTPHHGSHERVFRSLATGTLVLTNRTGWFAAEAPADALVQVDLERDDVGAVVDGLLADPERAAAIAEAGATWFRRHHTWQHRVVTLEHWVDALKGSGSGER